MNLKCFLSSSTDSGSLCDSNPNQSGKNSWPELVGVNGEDAAKQIEKENHFVKAFVIFEGTIVIMDFRCDMVWVWINKHRVVSKVPQIG
ncbi:hypothetical protein L6164_016633 [Bauhinia variegata]|uniref:Uncharacterized protein n=1 Tax=Bauhinia variegata TaxID=167791 RepID=A0ACB9NQP6_BAUVA|nr:hypothetical protein L6164_016633 [Bauhinia variegata]